MKNYNKPMKTIWILFFLVLSLTAANSFADVTGHLAKQTVTFQSKGKTHRVEVHLSPTGSDILLTGAKKRNLSRSFPGENLMPVVTKRKNGGFTVAWTLFRQGNAQLCIYDSNADLSELIPIEDFKSAYTLDTVYFDGDPFLIVFMGNNSDNTEVFYYNLLNDSLVNVTQTPYCEQHAEVDDNRKNFTVVTDSIYKINHYEVSKPGLNIALTASHDIVYPGPTELPVLSGNARNTVVGFGDSITWGLMRMDVDNPNDYEHPELAYLTKIQEGLAASGYDPISTVNLGVPGNTSEQGVQRMDAAFAEASAYYCLVMFGTNDVTRTRQFDADASGENLEFILTRARDVYGMFPIISTIPPQKDEQNGLPGIAFYQYGTRVINEKIIEIAAENDIPYIDSFTAFYESEYDWEDLLEVVRGNHPSPLGHQVIADLFKEQILLVPPAAPTDFVVTDNSPTAKTVSWATNEEFDFSHYNVEFGYTATNLNRQITKTENEIKFMVFPLPTFYKPKIYYRIQAVDMDGNAGEFTETREIQF